MIVNSVVFSQITLPAYKDGNWSLLNGTKTFQLEKGIESVGLFDSKNYTYILKNGLYGIIDAEGTQIVKPSFNSIKPLGFGLFFCVGPDENKILDIVTNKSLIQDFDQLSDLNKLFAMLHRDTFQFLIHKETQTITKYPDSLIFENFLNTVLIETDSIHSDFHYMNGTQYSILTDSIDYFNEYILLKEKDESKLITSKYQYSLNTSISNISFSENLLSFFDGKYAHLLNLETSEEILKLPYQIVLPAYFGGYIVTNNNLKGWINEDFKLKIPIKYDFILKTGNNYEVHKNGLCGLYDSLFTLKIPCEFQYFTLEEKFTKVNTVIKTMGLFSNLSNKMLLAPIYDNIIINKNIVKAYIDNKIRIVELSSEHIIKSDFILNDAITANQNIHIIDTNFKYDARLLTLGWFFDTQIITNTFGEIVKYRHNWGLNNSNDSLLISPKFKELIFLPNCNYTLLKMGTKEHQLITGKKEINIVFQFINHSTGRTFGNYEIIEVDTFDCYNRDYVRFECTNGYKILFAGDTVRSVNYISSSYNKYLNYCTGGKPVFFEKSKESVNLSHFSLNGKKTNSTSYLDQNSNKWMNQVIYQGAKWNYLDTNGQNLFSENFEFADEFYRNSAIAKRKTGWGAVNKDSVIIPMKFAEISRIPEFQDTVFKVKVIHGTKIYLNAQAEPMNAGFSHVKTIDKLSVMKLKNDFSIYTNGLVVAEKLKNAKLLNDNKYVIRKKKEYFVYDASGNEISSFHRKPVLSLGENIAVEESGKIALLNLSGDTLISSGKQSLEIIGIFTVCKSAHITKIYDEDLKELYVSGNSEQVYIDEYTNQYAVLKRDKIAIYDRMGKCLKKVKKPNDSDIDLYQNGIFISSDCIFSENDCIMLSEYEKIVQFDAGYVGITNQNLETRIYFNSLQHGIIELTGRNIKYLGEDVFCYKSKKGLVLRNPEKEIILGFNTRAFGTFSNGFCLFRVGNDYKFLNASFENTFNRSFENATPFQNNMATVQDGDGWTIINVQGLLQSFPSFNRIEQLSENLFETTEKSTYGLYDNHGNQILAPIYEKITIVSKDIIQVVKNGEIGYFDAVGKAIFSLE